LNGGFHPERERGRLKKQNRGYSISVRGSGKEKEKGAGFVDTG